MRSDLGIIENWIKPQAHVLDLGCGNGELLAFLRQQKKITGYGLEINSSDISDCINNGVHVIEQNLNDGLTNFNSNSFDVVIMSLALQAVQFPDIILDEMLRVGKQSIITFPNFGHWRCRFYLFGKGRMPISKALPYSWYNTPNIHLCTFKDFEALCQQKNIHILERTVVDKSHRSHWSARLWPNMFGEIVLYHVTK